MADECTPGQSASRRILQPRSSILLHRRAVLQLTGSALLGAGLVARPCPAFAQQLTKASQKRVAASKASVWFNDREDGLSPRGTIIRNANEAIKKALDQDQTVQMTFGRNLTRKGRAYQAWLFSDHFFVFPLSSRDEELVDIEDNSTRTWTSNPRKDMTTYPLAANLHSVKITNAKALKGSAQMVGSVTSERLADANADYSWRFTYRTEQYTRQIWTSLKKDTPPPDGPAEFTIDPVNEPGEKKPHAGPLVVFAELCTTERPRDTETMTTLHSNPVAVMVNIVA